MRYYLDCEFNGFGGELLSMAIARADHRLFYWRKVEIAVLKLDPWVLDNVLPIMKAVPAWTVLFLDDSPASMIIEALGGDPAPLVIADWPDDFTYLTRALITGPGTMIDIPRITMHVARVDAYPTSLPGAVQHNAAWDAMALWHMLEPGMRVLNG